MTRRYIEVQSWNWEVIAMIALIVSGGAALAVLAVSPPTLPGWFVYLFGVVVGIICAAYANLFGLRETDKRYIKTERGDE